MRGRTRLTGGIDVLAVGVAAAGLFAQQPAGGTAEKPAEKPAEKVVTPPAETGAKPKPAGTPVFEGEAKEVASGFKFTEGPVWHAERGELFFSDIPARTIFRFKPGTDKPVVLREKSGRANGLAIDALGRLVMCESDGRVTRGTLTDTGVAEVVVLAERFEDQRLNSPNDVVLHPGDGSIYFTDPSFFVKKDDRQLDYCGVFRITPSGKLELLDKTLSMPNGLTLSIDGKTMYVSDQRTSLVHRYDMNADGTFGKGRVLADVRYVGLPAGRGSADGLKVDVLGNVYSTGPGGVVCLSPTGEPLGHVAVAGASNMCFGGPDMRDLYITAGDKVFVVRTVNAGHAANAAKR
jgi:sugar lactone lactonase YvrE